MSSRRKENSSSTIVTTTATESSHAPTLRIATRPRPLAWRPAGRPRPAAVVDGARPRIMPLDVSMIARTSAESSARTPSRSIAAQAFSSVRATTGRSARGISAIARSSSASSGSAGRARGLAASANSVSTASTVAHVGPHAADDIVARPPDDARPSPTRPSMPIMTWSSCP
jgi:hypothetical protein